MTKRATALGAYVRRHVRELLGIHARGMGAAQDTLVVLAASSGFSRFAIRYAAASSRRVLVGVH